MKIITDFPIARDSEDHINPRGAKQDNTHCPAFVEACQRLYKDPSLLDLGCSGGGLVKDFLDAGLIACGVEGCDWHKQHGTGEWNNIPGRLFNADITKPFIIDQNFKIVTAWEVLEHIKEEDLPQLFLNIRNHLDDDGMFVASISLVPDEKWHVTLKDREWWSKKLLESGLSETTIAFFTVQEMARGSNNPHAIGDWCGNGQGFHIVCRKV